VQAGLALDRSGRNGAGRTGALVVGEVANRVNNANSRGDGQVSLRFVRFFPQCPARNLALSTATWSLSWLVYLTVQTRSLPKMLWLLHQQAELPPLGKVRQFGSFKL